MVCLVLTGFLYPPPPWKVFHCRLREVLRHLRREMAWEGGCNGRVDNSFPWGVSSGGFSLPLSPSWHSLGLAAVKDDREIALESACGESALKISLKFFLPSSHRKWSLIWDPPRPGTEVSRPFGPGTPKSPKRVRKGVPGPRAPESRKVPKECAPESDKSPKVRSFGLLLAPSLRTVTSLNKEARLLKFHFS